MIQDEDSTSAPRWGLPSIVGYSAAIGLVSTLVQISALIIVTPIVRQLNPALSEGGWEWLESNGLLLSVTTFGSAAVCLPLIRSLVARREARPWAFLGFARVRAPEVLAWSVATLAFIAASDGLSVALGRPVVPRFVEAAYATSGHPSVLFLAVVVAAPLVEEVFFRGFLMGALEATGVPVLPRIVVPSAAWAILHLQYDPYQVGSIFVLGLLIGLARVRTGSVVPCLVMHSLVGFVAFVQAAFVVSS